MRKCCVHCRTLNLLITKNIENLDATLQILKNALKISAKFDKREHSTTKFYKKKLKVEKLKKNRQKNENNSLGSNIFMNPKPSMTRKILSISMNFFLFTSSYVPCNSKIIKIGC